MEIEIKGLKELIDTSYERGIRLGEERIINQIMIALNDKGNNLKTRRQMIIFMENKIKNDKILRDGFKELENKNGN